MREDIAPRARPGPFYANGVFSGTPALVVARVVDAALQAHQGDGLRRLGLAFLPEPRGHRCRPTCRPLSSRGSLEISEEEALSLLAALQPTGAASPRLPDLSRRNTAATPTGAASRAALRRMPRK